MLYVIVILLVIIITLVVTRYLMRKAQSEPCIDKFDIIYTEKITESANLEEDGPFTLDIVRIGKTGKRDELLTVSNKTEALQKALEILSNDKAQYVKIVKNTPTCFSMKIPSYCLRNQENGIIYISITKQ